MGKKVAGEYVGVIYNHKQLRTIVCGRQSVGGWVYVLVVLIIYDA